MKVKSHKNKRDPESRSGKHFLFTIKQLSMVLKVKSHKKTLSRSALWKAFFVYNQTVIDDMEKYSSNLGSHPCGVKSPEARSWIYCPANFPV